MGSIDPPLPDITASFVKEDRYRYGGMIVPLLAAREDAQLSGRKFGVIRAIFSETRSNEARSRHGDFFIMLVQRM